MPTYSYFTLALQLYKIHPSLLKGPKVLLGGGVCVEVDDGEEGKRMSSAGKLSSAHTTAGYNPE